MVSGILVARIWKIPVRLHLSWFLIFALVTWSLAEAYFPAGYPGLERRSLWLLAGATSLLFAISVLIHELGHVYVALRNGVPVRGITLFIFGGMAQIGGEPATPGAEFRVAIAGPLASLALASLFGGLYLLDRSIPFLAAPSAWLARMNLLLGLFNLTPGFPLDGGRVLRAAVWQLTGNPLRSTRIAATIGRAVAYGFIFFGILGVATGQSLNGIWLLLIGWFLQSSASGAYRQAGVYHLLRGLRVSQLMGPRPGSVSPALTLERLVNERVMGSGERMFLVDGAADGRAHGILTLQEIKAVPRKKWAAVTAVEALARRSLAAPLRPDMLLVDALLVMDEARVNQAPVVADGALQGVLTRERVLQYIQTRLELPA